MNSRIRMIFGLLLVTALLSILVYQQIRRWPPLPPHTSGLSISVPFRYSKSDEVPIIEFIREVKPLHEIVVLTTDRGENIVISADRSLKKGDLVLVKPYVVRDSGINSTVILYAERVEPKNE